MAIVKSYGPRGYLPKYGIDETGKTVELYPGDLIKTTNEPNETYNHDLLNISRDDEPDLLTGANTYTGTTDTERIAWLIEQMRRLQVAYSMYLQKVQDMAKTESTLAATVGTVLTATATGLIKTNPAAALFLGVPGVLVKFLSSQTAKKIQAFKLEKIKEWAAIMAGLEQQYAAYQKELDGLQMVQNVFNLAMAGGLAYLLYRFSRE